MLFPRQRDEDPDSSRRADIQKPTRWDVIDADKIETDPAHLRQITLSLLRRSQVMAFAVGTERPISDPLDEELAVAFEEKFRDGANRTRGSRAHSGAWIV